MVPNQILVKRLLALEGDWLSVPGRIDIEKIPKVQSKKRLKIMVQACAAHGMSDAKEYEACLQGHCWAEGDNYGHSEDSHTKFGSVCAPY